MVSANTDGVPVKLEFWGGAHTLFNNTKEFNIVLPSSETSWTIKNLLVWIKDNILTGPAEMFVRGDTVRPGIIVVVNEKDWELLGALDYEIQPKDVIAFVSSLHGG